MLARGVKRAKDKDIQDHQDAQQDQDGPPKHPDHPCSLRQDQTCLDWFRHALFLILSDRDAKSGELGEPICAIFFTALC